MLTNVIDNASLYMVFVVLMQLWECQMKTTLFKVMESHLKPKCFQSTFRQSHLVQYVPPGLILLNSFSIVSSEVESIRFLTYRIFTEDIVSSSTSTSGSAQSTAIGCPHNWILPVQTDQKSD